MSGLRRRLTLLRDHFRLFGLARTARFVALRLLLRSRTRLLNAIPGARVACPCCGWTGRAFDDYIEVGYRLAHYVCPACGSQPRHRYFHLWLSGAEAAPLLSGAGLIFAFEKPLQGAWRGAPRLKAWRTDVAREREVDVVSDIEHLPFADGAFDFVWCHHVLEHVEDDRAAMCELRRILRRPEGRLVVSVPSCDMPATLEYGQPDPAESGHRRRYGTDFADRLAAAGLACQAERMQLAGEQMRRFGLQPDLFFICRPSGP